MADLPSVGPGPLAVGLTTALRRAGLPTTPERAAGLARGLQLVPPVDRSALYWTCRVALVTDRAQLPVFDAVFSAVFDGRLDPADTRGDPTAPLAVGSEPTVRPAPPDRRPGGGTAPGGAVAGAGSGEDDGGAAERDVVLAAASAEERLRHTSFADLEPDELAAVRALVRRIALATPERRSRRTHPTARRRDRLDLRRTVRAAQRAGGDPVRLLHASRRTEPRRLVLLCDVSASMEPYTRVYLSLLQGAVGGARAEAFVFATRLTRLTRRLAGRDPDRALARAAAAAPDWAGGTRLAAGIGEFATGPGRRGLARGAVVVVLSDGWATDDPADVAAAMLRLRRLAHRIVWVNPRKAAPGYAPLVGGMAAALPLCDAFVSGHSLAALEQVVAALGAARAGRDQDTRLAARVG
ncbi:VWA domain-containing protein [Geodermatophilus sp. DSM 44513]|uniref:vWA domain-containing protein n=1 Tax=Geodermatophilus sp. DSM 44513 TaxID=1528104 RepID=UPI0028F736F3|nr:VWA domain-containing protein [Geodermatophilus sp. DSM 44513]WNV74324.1 VWA domain-containing protein [Geodermatophilus sp. DSM 44513]